MSFASVALPLPVEDTFTYRIPDSLAEDVSVGVAVVVPFGRRVLTGVVVALESKAPDFDVKDIQDVLDEEPVLSAEMIGLTRWIAEYYMCGWGEAIRAALPPGIDTASERRIRRVYSGDASSTNLDDSQLRLLEAMSPGEEISFSALRQRLKSTTLSKLRRLEARGFIEIEQVLRRPRVRIKTERVVSPAANPPTDPPRGIRQLAVLDELSNNGSLPQPELLRRSGASSAVVRRLEELGYVRLSEREVDRSLESDQAYDRANGMDSAGGAAATGNAGGRAFELNDPQKAAIDRLETAINADAFATFLLHGITGSGKTEVYIEAVNRTLARKRRAIILVPEIALTPQTVRRFRSRFGDGIAVLHSRLSPGERFDAWRRIRSGDADVVIGPRSAVLAPIDNLGIVVVDEEHEPSYKQFDPAPRYHARDVAVFRAHENGAICLLGSATPSLDSLANARAGKYELLALPDRIETARGKALLPSVRIVDMRSESRRAGAWPILSAPLKDAVETRLHAKEQVILLQNRRGYSPIVSCESCAWVPECPDCSVSMTWHKAKRHLRCHYCGRTAQLPRACPTCGEPSLSTIGVGTQRVEEELGDAFPDARIVRMDLDTTSAKNAHHRILDAFAGGKYDILLGTQMVAKGLDFGRVTLVGVIDADAGIRLPDIRAEERAFHLLTQVAGRAGRADLPGEVILQTRNPAHRVIQHVLQHAYDRFSTEILAERTVLGYPPAGRLTALMFTGPDESRVTRLADEWVKRAAGVVNGLELLGPSAAFVGRVRRQYRMQVMIKSPRNMPHRRIRAAIQAATAALGTLPRGYRLSVDVDPVSIV